MSPRPAPSPPTVSPAIPTPGLLSRDPPAQTSQPPGFHMPVFLSLRTQKERTSANCTVPLCFVVCSLPFFCLHGHCHCTICTSLATFSFRQERLTVCNVPSENGESHTSIISAHPVDPSLHCRYSQWLAPTDGVQGSRQGRSSSQQIRRNKSAATNREPDHVGERTRRFGSETLQW